MPNQEDLDALTNATEDNFDLINDPDVVQALEWLQADANRLQRPLARKEIEHVAYSLNLDVTKTAVLIEILDEKGIFELKDEFEPEDDEEALSLAEAEKALAKGTLRAAFQIPLLTADEERVLGRKIALGRGSSMNDEDPIRRQIALEADKARTRFALSNLRLIVYVARVYASYSGEDALEDLFQDGVFGLLTACDRYDPEFGTKFSTYAVWWIRQSITRAIMNKGRTIRLPVHIQADLFRYVRAVRLLRQEYAGVTPSTANIAAELTWTVEKTRFIGQLLMLDTISLDSSNREDGDNFGNSLPSTDSPELNAFVRERLEIVLHLLDRMGDSRMAYIIKRRFGLDDSGDGVTLETLGQELNLTRERIRQIESMGLSKLRTKASISGLKEDELNE